MSAQERRPKIVLDQRLESSLESVDQSEEKVVALAQEAGFPEEDTYRLGYAVREALVNAVVHGNRYSANKTVLFRVVCTERGIEILVQDQGEGFAADKQADPLAAENLMNQSGRGLALIKAFTDELIVESAQPSGTRVILRKFLPPEVI
jgi:serine/threonine-protein kinase RsbW